MPTTDSSPGIRLLLSLAVIVAIIVGGGFLLATLATKRRSLSVVASPVPTAPVQPVAPMPENASALPPETELFYAVRNADIARIEALLKGGASVSVTDDHGWTPLHVAALKGHAKVAALLLEHGADVNAEDIDGWRPLHVAALQGQTSVVDVLIAGKAVLDAGDDDGWTAPACGGQA